MTGKDCRYHHGLPIGRRLQWPTVSLLDGIFPKRMDDLSPQPEKDTMDAWGRSPVGDLTSAGILGITAPKPTMHLPAQEYHNSPF